MPTKRKTSLQCRASPQTCQAAKPSATKGISVTRPVMIRSRVSFATGWMSEGRGLGCCPCAADHTAPSLKPAIEPAADRKSYGCAAMPFASTAPLRREIEARIPERPFAVEFWDGTRLPATAGGGPDLLRPLAARRRPRRCGRRASSASAAPTSAARSRSTTWTR